MNVKERFEVWYEQSGWASSSLIDESDVKRALQTAFNAGFDAGWLRSLKA